MTSDLRPEALISIVNQNSRAVANHHQTNLPIPLLERIAELCPSDFTLVRMTCVSRKLRRVARSYRNSELELYINQPYWAADAQDMLDNFEPKEYKSLKALHLRIYMYDLQEASLASSEWKLLEAVLASLTSCHLLTVSLVFRTCGPGDERRHHQVTNANLPQCLDSTMWKALANYLHPNGTHSVRSKVSCLDLSMFSENSLNLDTSAWVRILGDFTYAPLDVWLFNRHAQAHQFLFFDPGWGRWQIPVGPHGSCRVRLNRLVTHRLCSECSNTCGQSERRQGGEVALSVTASVSHLELAALETPPSELFNCIAVCQDKLQHLALADFDGIGLVWPQEKINLPRLRHLSLLRIPLGAMSKLLTLFFGKTVTSLELEIRKGQLLDWLEDKDFVQSIQQTRILKRLALYVRASIDIWHGHNLHILESLALSLQDRQIVFNLHIKSCGGDDEIPDGLVFAKTTSEALRSSIVRLAVKLHHYGIPTARHIQADTYQRLREFHVLSYQQQDSATCLPHIFQSFEMPALSTLHIILRHMSHPTFLDDIKEVVVRLPGLKHISIACAETSDDKSPYVPALRKYMESKGIVLGTAKPRELSSE